MLSLIFITIILITALNICRGGRYFPEHILFSKWAIVIYQTVLFCIFTLVSGNHLVYSLLFIAPHAIELALGTGEQMLVANEDYLSEFKINKKKPINKALLYILKIDADNASDADKRRLSAWYCSVVGCIFYIPFIFTNWVVGLPVLLYGVILGVFRYVPPITINGVGDLTWRVVKEGFYMALYTGLFILAMYF